MQSFPLFISFYIPQVSVRRAKHLTRITAAHGLSRLVTQWYGTLLHSYGWCILVLCLIISSGSLVAQDLSGRWEGQLWQSDPSTGFRYELQLHQSDNAISGTAKSTSADGQMMATFTVGGKWDGQTLVLQEVEQTSPADPQWCLKFATLNLLVSDSTARLRGNWTAKGCQPGQIELRRAITGRAELAFDPIGRWTGHLGQSDREYGFYYEVNLQAGGNGTSHIVSEDNGGEATHRLRWYATAQGAYRIEEVGVIDRTDPQWRWCIKRGVWQLNRVGSAFRLTGPWSGYIEGKDQQTGACAPGNVYLEKPVLTRLELANVQEQRSPYEQRTERAVKIDRVIQVRQRRVLVRIWDSGTVDGDVATLFLNGERVLQNHRVSKRKYAFHIDVQDGENLMILHAEDLGDIVPNTVAVSIDDGTQEQVIIMSSNLQESGAILIQPFRLGQE